MKDTVKAFLVIILEFDGEWDVWEGSEDKLLTATEARASAAKYREKFPDLVEEGSVPHIVDYIRFKRMCEEEKN